MIGEGISYVIKVGTFEQGYQLYGPFMSEAQARAYAAEGGRFQYGAYELLKMNWVRS